MSYPSEISKARFDAVRRWADLAVRNRKNQLTEPEKIEWQEILAQDADVQKWLTEKEHSLIDELLLLSKQHRFESDVDTAIKRFYEQATTITDKPLFAGTVHRVHLLKTVWFRYAAAWLVIITGIALYYTFSNSSKPETAGIVQKSPPTSAKSVLPGYNRAVLTLSNGQRVELDSAASETIKDGSLSIKNANGQLVYSGGPNPSGEGVNKGGSQGSSNGERSSYNTMSTPKGGQYQLTLADGTIVWLNAASSITYPVIFKGPTREVSITGEAFFDVRPNKQKPFVVITSTDRVTVLGTSFNVNAYSDEVSVRISLLEGSINVNNTRIKPGQAYREGKVMKAAVEQDAAWRNGVFDFRNVSTEAALRQLARWYDVEIIYDNKIPKGTLGGRMGRNLTLQQVLEGLDGIIARFRLEGRKLHVSAL